MEMIVNGQPVEWDDDKNKLNIKKHGISFETAALVFSDPFRVEMYDEEHSDEEDRIYVLGLVGDVLFVVYTERGEYARLISARAAVPEERRVYDGYY